MVDRYPDIKGRDTGGRFRVKILVSVCFGMICPFFFFSLLPSLHVHVLVCLCLVLRYEYLGSYRHFQLVSSFLNT